MYWYSLFTQQDCRKLNHLQSTNIKQTTHHLLKRSRYDTVQQSPNTCTNIKFHVPLQILAIKVLLLIGLQYFTNLSHFFKKIIFLYFLSYCCYEIVADGKSRKHWNILINNLSLCTKRWKMPKILTLTPVKWNWYQIPKP